MGELAISDLKPAPYNPRTIDADSLEGLAESMHRFGDLSGIVWNKRSGHLVCGHQRMDALKKQHGKALTVEDGAVITPDGERFPVRIVDLDEHDEQAANIAANSPLLAGNFTPDLDPLLAGLKDAMPDLSKALRFDAIPIPYNFDAEPPEDNEEIPEAKGQETITCPECGHEWKA